MKAKAEVLLNGLTIPEGMRWRDGKLWFSDLLAYRVLNCDERGQAQVLALVPNRPSGLGFTRDGKLLIVSMQDSRLLRLESSGPVELANLSGIVRAYCNDMVVDASGRAYVGDVGYNRHAGESPRPGALIRVDPDGRMSVAADDILFPNGSAITADGRSLILAETFGHRLSAFDIDERGGLSNRRVFAEMDGTPDGLCLDAEGAVWVADHMGHRIIRILDGGRIACTIPTGERHAFACALGGADRRTLFFSTGIGNTHAEFQANKQGRIEFLRVDVPGAGIP